MGPLLLNHSQSPLIPIPGAAPKTREKPKTEFARQDALGQRPQPHLDCEQVVAGSAFGSCAPWLTLASALPALEGVDLDSQEQLSDTHGPMRRLALAPPYASTMCTRPGIIHNGLLW